jgi:phospholipase/carboxylesterase
MELENMTEDNTSRQIFDLDGWVIQSRIPNGGGPHPVILMLHGWTGDEDAMWIFAPHLPKDCILLAPRGLYKTSLGGYGWHAYKPQVWPWVDDFRPAMDAILELLTIQHVPEANLEDIRLVGFSQGAALAYTFSLYYPWQVRSLAGLSGFLPDGAQALVRNRPLIDKKIFVAHGTQDELVHVGRARDAVKLLGEAGARVTYCEDDVGHKLSPSCFRGLKTFFERY